MEKLRFGIIGCGGIANVKHLPALDTFKDEIELVYFCDTVLERAQEVAKKYGTKDAKYCEDYHELLEDETIDVVHVLTPNVNHCPITCDALEAGKHVLCEKPMAISYEEGKKMLDTAKRTGKKLTIGYQNRFRKDTRQMYELVRSGELGEIYFAKAHGVRRRGVPTWGVFPDKSKQGGGPLIDIGTHPLDMTLWLMDNYRPVSVLGQTFQKLKDHPEGNKFGPWDSNTFETEDSAFGLIRMENGATIYLEAAWAINMLNCKDAMVTLCGTLGGSEMFGDNWDNRGYLVTNKVAQGQLVDVQPAETAGVYGFDGVDMTDPKIMEARQWIDAIKNDTQPLVKPEEALVVTRILEAIYQSAETGKAVYFTYDD